MRTKYYFMGNGNNFVRIVARLLGSEYISENLSDGVEFRHSATGRRVLKLIDSKDTLSVRFDYPVPNINKNTREVQHEHHMHWDHDSTDLDAIVALIEIELKNFKSQLMKELGGSNE
jgi:hypothetical protein